MFIVTTLIDRIRVPANLLPMPTLEALSRQIDAKYPGRVILDVGLVICRYGDDDGNGSGTGRGGIQRLSHGACVPGDGGSLHECQFQLLVFRPFVEEVLLGTIHKCTPEGLQVSLGGFFHDIMIPAYWMLNKSEFSETTREWIWTYANDDENDADVITKENATANGEQGDDNDADTDEKVVKTEEGLNLESQEDDAKETLVQYPMKVGDVIRFKVKSIQFTEVTDTAKGRRATTTTTDHSHSFPTSSSSSSSNNNSRSGSGKNAAADEMTGGGGASSTSADQQPRPLHIH